MSLMGLMTGRRSVRVTVKRPTFTRASDGSSTPTWATIATERGFAADIADDVRHRLFGDGVAADLRILVPTSSAIADKDGLIALDGPFANQRFRVTGRRIADTRPRTAHVELALQSTTEVF